MNKEDLLFLADMLCDYDVTLLNSVEKKEYFDLLKRKIFAIVEQIHIQENNQKIAEELNEIEQKQNELKIRKKKIRK